MDRAKPPSSCTLFPRNAWVTSVRTALFLEGLHYGMVVKRKTEFDAQFCSYREALGKFLTSPPRFPPLYRENSYNCSFQGCPEGKGEWNHVCLQASEGWPRGQGEEGAVNHPGPVQGFDLNLWISNQTTSLLPNYQERGEDVEGWEKGGEPSSAELLFLPSRAPMWVIHFFFPDVNLVFIFR